MRSCLLTPFGKPPHLPPAVVLQQSPGVVFELGAIVVQFYARANHRLGKSTHLAVAFSGFAHLLVVKSVHAF